MQLQETVADQRISTKSLITVGNLQTKYSTALGPKSPVVCPADHPQYSAEGELAQYISERIVFAPK